MKKRDTLDLRRGRNVWLIARTDRDGATRELAQSTALVVIKRWLQSWSPVGARATFIEYANKTFAIGSARPVTIAVFSERPELGELGRKSMYTDCPVLRLINARDPWWVVLAFEWHGPEFAIQWPRLSVDAIGREDDNDQALDWLLVEAHGGAELEQQTQRPMEVAWHKSA